MISAEKLEAEGDLVVRGNVTVADDIRVLDGSMAFYGNLISRRVDIDKSLHVSQDLQADDVDVGGSLEVEGKEKVESRRGGSFVARGEAEVKKVDVGGSVVLESEANIQELDVGGTARVSRGKVLEIDVGGSFESKGQLEFREIDVGGIPPFNRLFYSSIHPAFYKRRNYRQDFLQKSRRKNIRQQYSCSLTFLINFFI